MHVSVTPMGATVGTNGNSIMADVSAVTFAKLSTISCGPFTTTTVRVYIFNDGSANFIAGDRMYVTMRAEGRWA
jgi:hypothetical protein